MRLLALRAVGMIRHTAVEIAKRWWTHSHSRSAAALAFYSLFSMVPILLIVTRLASMLIGKEKAEEEIGQAAEMVFDERSGDYLRELLIAQPGAAFAGVSSVIGTIVLLVTASKVVVELRDVLTTIFGRRHREGRHGLVIGILLDQGIPLLLVVSLGLVLAASAIASALLRLITTRLGHFLHVDLWLWDLAQAVIPLVFVTLLFALILRVLPPRPPGFRDSIVGGLVACGLLAGLRGLIGFYFGQSSITTAYGAAVTLVVILLWIYFTIQIFFIGAETAAYLDRRRRPREMPEPSKMVE